MSLTSAFFDAELVGGEYDRVYSAEHFAEYFAAFIANGVFPDPATNLQVVANIPSDMTVLVKPGLGWINGYYCNNDGNYSLTISPASGTLPRVDAVVLRWSRSNRSISLGVKTGTANSNPVAPSLERSSDTYELMLASIIVAAGATSIAQASITDKRPDSTVCGWVQGTVDQIDTTDLFAQYDNAFQTWFDSIKAQLSGNVATNLQNQINELKTGKVNVSDKATDSEAKAATNDTHWMTPAKVAKAIGANTYKIGDMLKTYRTDLDNTWLSCDGSAISKTLYPDLYQLLRNGGSVSAIGRSITLGARGQLLRYPYHRLAPPGPYSQKTTAKPGVQAVLLVDSDSYPYVAYKFSGEDWVIPTSHNSGLRRYSSKCTQIRYLNGRYLMALDGGSSTEYFDLAYSTDLITWSLVNIASGSGGNISNNYEIFHVEYVGGMYYVYYTSYAYYSDTSPMGLQCAYSTSLSSMATKSVTKVSAISTVLVIGDYLYIIDSGGKKIYRITGGISTELATYTDVVGIFTVNPGSNNTACMDQSGNIYVTTGANTLTIFEKISASEYKARTYTTSIVGTGKEYLVIGLTPVGVTLMAPTDNYCSSAKVAIVMDIYGTLNEVGEAMGTSTNSTYSTIWISEDTEALLTIFNGNEASNGYAKLQSDQFAVSIPSSSDNGPEYIKAKEG